ncbi:hypothetical protein BOTNAR_0048g00100 [Botryotinia narcissicola]|uniref:Uncharacterized protein n=1 Tax=Botryotinia narcissicola TaxID=278944 RepID=A0A4Z1J685_9HELO|nr:hypothetical protein BOTNAR_0048g00100 [Botryotinia narcissicola]
MSCTDPNDTLFPVLLLAGSDEYVNACTAGNITSNSAAVSAMTKCCGSAPVNVIMDGCYSYCNVTSSADQQAFEQCFGSSAGITPDVDYGCTLDDASGHEIPGSGTITPSSTGTSAAIATLVPITVTTSSGPTTTTATSGQATVIVAANSTSASASGTEKPSTTGKTSGSASSSAATASTTANAGPTVKQFSKGAMVVIALAFARLLV